MYAEMYTMYTHYDSTDAQVSILERWFSYVGLIHTYCNVLFIKQKRKKSNVITQTYRNNLCLVHILIRHISLKTMLTWLNKNS